MKPIFPNIRMRSHIKLFFLFIITFILPVSLLTVVFSQTYMDIAKNDFVLSNQREMNQLSRNIDAQFGKLVSYASLVSRDTDLCKYLRSMTEPQGDSNIDVTDVQLILDRYSLALGTLYPDVAVADSNCNAVGGAAFLSEMLALSQFRTALIDINQSARLIGAVWLSESELFGYDILPDSSYFYIFRTVWDPDTYERLGTIILRLRESNLARMYLTSMSDSQSIFVLNQSGQIVSCVDWLGFYNTFQSEYSNQALINSEPFIEKNMLIYGETATNSLWRIVSVSDLNLVTSDFLRTNSIFIAVFIGCIVLSLMLSYMFSKNFMVPIKQLTTQMNVVKAGNLSARVSVTTNDEIGALAQDYNDMLDRLQALINQVVTEQRQKRKSDIRALQSQINPHFIYNTLASIRYMILSNKREDADTVILALIRILKSVLSRTDTFITVNMEVEQLKNYIIIQQFSFSTPLKVDFDIQDEIGEFRIIKLLLQPIVENAIFHGLKAQSNSPHLLIQGHALGEDQIEFIIQDNGRGFDTSRLADKSYNVREEDHIGLENVDQRLKLHFGPEYGLVIHSVIGQGTTVVIRIPKLTENGDDF